MLHERYMRAALLYNQRRFADAERELRDLLTSDPEQPEALQLLAATFSPKTVFPKRKAPRKVFSAFHRRVRMRMIYWRASSWWMRMRAWPRNMR